MRNKLDLVWFEMASNAENLPYDAVIMIFKVDNSSEIHSLHEPEQMAVNTSFQLYDLTHRPLD